MTRNRFKHKKILMFSIFVSFVALFVVSSVTIAGFVNYTNVPSISITAAGSRYLYLKPTGYWNSDSPVFLLRSWNDGGSKQWYGSVKTVGTGENIYYVFPIPKYAGFMFIREKPGTTASWAQSNDSSALTHTDSGGSAWNKTGDFTLTSTTYNLITITSTGTKMSTAATATTGTYTA